MSTKNINNTNNGETTVTLTVVTEKGGSPKASSKAKNILENPELVQAMVFGRGMCHEESKAALDALLALLNMNEEERTKKGALATILNKPDERLGDLIAVVESFPNEERQALINFLQKESTKTLIGIGDVKRIYHAACDAVDANTKCLKQFAQVVCDTFRTLPAFMDSKASADETKEQVISRIIDAMKKTKSKTKKKSKKKGTDSDDSDGANKPQHVTSTAVRSSIVSIINAKAINAKDAIQASLHKDVSTAMKGILTDSDTARLAELLKKFPAKGTKADTKPREEAIANLQRGVLPSGAFGVTPTELAERFDKVFEQASASKKRCREDDDISDDDKNAKRSKGSSGSESSDSDSD